MPKRTTQRYPYLRLCMMLALLLSSIGPSIAMPMSAQTTGRRFVETGHTISGRFLDYWNTHGGLAQQGFPISEPFREQSDLDGKNYTVQYFERAVFELHPENTAPYNVLLSQLGTLRYKQRYASAGEGHIEPAAAMSVARSCHSATLLNNGKVLIAGGMLREGKYLADAELYDPATGKWSATGSMSVGRACHRAVLLANGKVLAIAGSYGGSLNDAELYDPATGKWIMTGSMSTRRDAFTATLLKDGKVLVAGGYKALASGSYGDGMLSTAEVYDPATGRWSTTGSMKEKRGIHTATLLADGKVLMAGGGKNSILSTAEVYDPATGAFLKTGSMALPRYKHAAMLLPNGNVLIIAGADNRDWRGRYTSSEIYNPVTGAFSNAANMSIERFKLFDAVAPLQNGAYLVAGGGDRAEIYNAANNTFTVAAGSLDVARSYQTATTLPDGRVLIAGGYSNNIESTAGTWLYVP